MSYAHTKRRKLIASLKRKHGLKWRNHFTAHCDIKRREIDGPLLGSLEDLIGI